MRWSNLLVEAEEAQTLPGYRDPAVVRRFDAPEALDTRFYEVHAKSALNQVPKQSRMFFRWTINPYRGCSHACNYCLGPDTPVLLASGRAKPIADLRAGDSVYGTVREGAYLRYRKTEVLAHWQTFKEAFRVVLQDGTELVASGDHRFLTGRGWKHVSDAPRGQRPHLTTNDKLMGFGQLADGPADSCDYRLGYLTGVIRGDGHIGARRYERAGRYSWHHAFRLALTDFEALRRASDYLSYFEVATREQAFATAAGSRPMRAIGTGVRDSVEAVYRLTRWPRSPTRNWCKGFLAGIFDAEGSSSGGVVRIANANQEIVDSIVGCLSQFGFSSVIERPPNKNGVRYVRLLGGLPEQSRFFHMVDPAITRKRSLEGKAVKSPAPLGVAAIEPLGRKVEMYDITTGTGDFIANGVVSHNCFARPTHKFLDFDAGRDFEKEIVVKVNLPEVLRAELARPSWKREHVALGTNTDPYQWVEGRYKLMPEVWRALLESGTPCSLLTKSPLMLRDLELMQELARTVGFTANVSVPTLDEKAWRATEPHTPHPRKRLEALGELTRAGIPTGVLIAPLMPGINDSPEQVERILELATENGAGSVSGITLHMRGEVRDVFMGWLRAQRPDLVDHYERLYRRGAYAPSAERQRHAELVRAARRKVGAPARGRGRRFPAPAAGPTAGRPDPAPGDREARAKPLPKQESLF